MLAVGHDLVAAALGIDRLITDLSERGFAEVFQNFRHIALKNLNFAYFSIFLTDLSIVFTLKICYYIYINCGGYAAKKKGDLWTIYTY
jgi:hypothetical protein